jgi:hypothetical protein
LAPLFYSTIQLSHIYRRTGHAGKPKCGLLLQYNASLTQVKSNVFIQVYKAKGPQYPYKTYNVLSAPYTIHVYKIH